MPENPDELTGAERAALAAWWLARKQQVTNREIADRLGLSYEGARSLLLRLSVVLPICFDQPHPGLEGYWYTIG